MPENIIQIDQHMFETETTELIIVSWTAMTRIKQTLTADDTFRQGDS